MADNKNKEKKKSPWGTIILLAILLILLGLFIATYIQDEKQLGTCKSAEDCGRYNVFYIKGSGYVCANNLLMNQNSIKSRILMFKYASKKAANFEPPGCSCIENQCEINES